MNEDTYLKRFTGSVDKLGRVAVVYGGESAERKISLKSGAAIVDGLRSKKVDVLGFDLNYSTLNEFLSASYDRVFIGLHGAGGEDGKIQGLLDWKRIPYTGSGVAASALALNKLKTKLVWKALALPTPEFKVLSANSNYSEVLQQLGGECFVKPVNEGSSLGMRCVKTASALNDAFREAMKHEDEVIAESRVVGREFTVALLNGEVLPPIELVCQSDFYDFEAKYESNQTQYVCPSTLESSEVQELKGIAKAAFESLGCKHWGRVDLMQDEKSGQFYLLEVNTVPGMTDHSLVPMAAKAAGLEFGELLLEILNETLQVGVK